MYPFATLFYDGVSFKYRGLLFRYPVRAHDYAGVPLVYRVRAFWYGDVAMNCANVHLNCTGVGHEYPFAILYSLRWRLLHYGASNQYDYIRSKADGKKHQTESDTAA